MVAHRVLSISTITRMRLAVAWRDSMMRMSWLSVTCKTMTLMTVRSSCAWRAVAGLCVAVRRIAKWHHVHRWHSIVRRREEVSRHTPRRHTSRHRTRVVTRCTEGLMDVVGVRVIRGLLYHVLVGSCYLHLRPGELRRICSFALFFGVEEGLLVGSISSAIVVGSHCLMVSVSLVDSMSDWATFLVRFLAHQRHAVRMWDCCLLWRTFLLAYCVLSLFCHLEEDLLGSMAGDADVVSCLYDVHLLCSHHPQQKTFLVLWDFFTLFGGWLLMLICGV